MYIMYVYLSLARYYYRHAAMGDDLFLFTCSNVHVDLLHVEYVL